MSETTVEAKQRVKSGGKFKEAGLVAGVIYGDGVEGAKPVKFDEASINRVIAKQGVNAKIWINLDNKKAYGFIKEIQRDVMTRKVVHLDVQMVSKDHEIQMQMPIVYENESELRVQQLQLQVYKAEVGIYGKMALLPESITVDVANMKVGDAVMAKDLGIDVSIVNDPEDTVYGTVTHIKIIGAEVEEAVEAEDTPVVEA